MSLLEALRQPHALYVLEHAKVLVPGIQRMVTCFYHDQKTQVWQLDADDSMAQPLQLSDSLLEKLSFYRHRRREQWVSNEDLDFDFESSEPSQKLVFDELEKHVLILSFQNVEDKAFDCIFFYFNKDASNFGLRKQGDVLTTDSKAIISNILKQSLNLILEQRRGFEQEVDQYKNYLRKVSSQYKKAKQQLEEFQSGRQERLLHYAGQIIRDLAHETNYEIILTQPAKDLIQNFEGGRELLPEALRKAVQFAIYSAPGTEMITLEDWHLDLEEEDTREESYQQPVDVRYQKTFTYLNKLEEAARKAYSQHLKLTSKNVGQCMAQPVSAPAITDALRNHHKNIHSLFGLYPDRWSLIRREFRPITNLIEKGRQGGISQTA